jgi:hypothetical protein
MRLPCFDGKACWIGVDVHKSSYAVAILDVDGQRLGFSTKAEPKKLLLQLVQMDVHIKIADFELRLTHADAKGFGLI